ncbi:MAG: segregation/condensation protein A [Spirochaetia bacterium]|nr:segregation/condensation protein A [Spirochaetia bacterium]
MNEIQDGKDIQSDTSGTLRENLYKVQLDSFEGPLDLLLFLIQKNEVNIYDIPIAEITEQYMQYLQYATEIELDNLTDFYVMASTLIYIKSRMLLPVDIEFDEEYDDPRKDLVEKLLEYQKFKKYADVISQKEESSEWFITRKKNQRILPFEDQDIWEDVDIWDLLKTFNSLLSGINNENVFNVYEEVSVKEKTTYLIELLETKKEFPFYDLIINEHSALDIICSFLAILEAVKIRLIKLVQHALFGDIMIKKNDTYLNHEEHKDMGYE